MTDTEMRRSTMPPALPEPPSAARLNGEWQWGRYRLPIPSPDLGTGVVRRMRLK